MTAKELYEAYEGRDVVLHITDGELTERKVVSITVNKATDRLKYAEVYSFRFEDDRLVMYADVRTILYNLYIKRESEEEE